MTGDPRVLPTFRRFFVEPADPAIWRYPLQFQLGDALLVVPVVEPGATGVSAYLPSGRWVDVWTGTERTGPAELRLPAPLARPPVLCRAEHWPRLAASFG